MHTLSAAHNFPKPGEILADKYSIERTLGEGGMGAVIQAQHMLRRVPVALKFIHPNVVAMPGAVDRFYNEAVAASRIANEHVVQIYDVDRLPSGVPFIVMEFLAGHDLAQALESTPRLALARAVHITIQILRALAVAHRAGVVHRDMKPSNVFLVNRDGDPDFVKLVDFGISKVRSGDGTDEASLTQINSTLGTPLYMAPEQARSAREVDARSDIYSVGVILYEMVSGRTPYIAETGEMTEILYKLFTTDPPGLGDLCPHLDPAFAAVVARAMNKNPAARHESAGAFAAALMPFADGRSTNEIHRLQQAELAAGSSEARMRSDRLGAESHVQVLSSRDFLGIDVHGSTHLGTAVGVVSPIILGRGHTEAIGAALPASSDSKTAPTAWGSSRRFTLAVGAVVVAALSIVAVRALFFPEPVSKSGEAPGGAEARAQDATAPRGPIDPVMEGPYRGPNPAQTGGQSAAAPPHAAQVPAAPGAPSGAVGAQKSSAAPSTAVGGVGGVGTKAAGERPKAAPAGKPKLNDLGLDN